jgi:cob(I)alamin adenosyltransferase
MSEQLKTFWQKYGAPAKFAGWLVTTAFMAGVAYNTTTMKAELKEELRAVAQEIFDAGIASHNREMRPKMESLERVDADLQEADAEMKRMVERAVDRIENKIDVLTLRIYELKRK